MQRYSDSKVHQKNRAGAGHSAGIHHETSRPQLTIQRMQQTIGNRVTGEWLSRIHTPTTKTRGSGSDSIIQMQRDLKPQTTVSVSEEGESDVSLYGQVKELIEDDSYKLYNYLVKVKSKTVRLGKEDNYALKDEVIEQPFQEKTDHINSYLEGEEDAVNSIVEFYSETLGTHAKGVIEEVEPLPSPQLYDVAVSWNHGTKLKEPYVEQFNEEEVNQVDHIPDEHPLRPEPKDGYTFTHFHEDNREIRAAEYLEPGKDKLDWTKHGLGSGIYGLSGLSQEAIDKQESSYNAKAEKVTLKQPLHIQNDKHGEEFTIMSKRLEKLAEIIKNKFGEKASEIESIEQGLQENKKIVNELMQNMSMVLLRLRKDPPDLSIITKGLTQFLQAYYARSTHVAQPINYLMNLLGFDGVFAESGRFNKFDYGNIKYVSDEDDTIEKTYSKDRLNK